MDFDIRRLRRSDRVVGVSVLAFAVVLFTFKWYGASISAGFGGITVSHELNGWHTFTNSRWIWLATILAGLVAVAAVAGDRPLQRHLQVQPSAIVAGLGALSTALVAYRILHHPSGATSSIVGAARFSYSYGIELGIWLGLIAAAGVTYGGYLGMREEGAGLRP